MEYLIRLNLEGGLIMEGSKKKKEKDLSVKKAKQISYIIISFNK